MSSDEQSPYADPLKIWFKRGHHINNDKNMSYTWNMGEKGNPHAI